MSGVNKVILLGNLGADPEIRHLESGSKVANISIATSEAFVNRNGERIEHTEWHKVELWDKLAELCEKYLSKGRTVYIEGRIRTNTYQDKDGVTRYDKRIRASSMTFVGSAPDTNDSGTGSSQQPVASKSTAPPPEVNNGGDESETDDLPF